MRVIKNAEERKNEILDVADELFGEKGFDGTSTNDILEKVGIARGTLYYHFKSKEDIMDALIKRYNIQILSKAKKVANDKNIPPNERIIRVAMDLKINSKSGKKIIEHMHRPQNALMNQKIQKTVINNVTPILTDIICEGVEQGLFHTPFPYECVEMFITYANIIFDNDIVEMTNDVRELRIQAFIFNIERLLGAENGTLMNVVQIFNNEGGGNNEE